MDHHQYVRTVYLPSNNRCLSCSILFCQLARDQRDLLYRRLPDEPFAPEVICQRTSSLLNEKSFGR